MPLLKDTGATRYRSRYLGVTNLAGAVPGGNGTAPACPAGALRAGNAAVTPQALRCSYQRSAWRPASDAV